LTKELRFGAPPRGLARPEALDCGRRERDRGARRGARGGEGERASGVPTLSALSYQRTGKRHDAHEDLTTATTMYRDMDMQFWLEQRGSGGGGAKLCERHPTPNRGFCGEASAAGDLRGANLRRDRRCGDGFASYTLVRLKSYGSFHPANDVRPPHQPGRIAESTYIAEPQLDGWRRYIHRGQRWHRRNLEETFDALRLAHG